MLNAELIKPMQSQWAGPVLIVPKQAYSLRFCVDYRRLTSVAVKYNYFLPRIDECLNSLGDKKVFFALDGICGYFKMLIPEGDRHKTVFGCQSGLNQYNSMPFLLTDAPASFQRAMDNILAKFRWKTCLACLEDFIIFSSSYKEHINHVDGNLRVLQGAVVQLKLGKCEFFCRMQQLPRRHLLASYDRD